MINDFLAIGETIGSGAFCKVKRAVGTFPDEDGDPEKVETETYALKVYNKNDLKRNFCASSNTENQLALKTSLD